MVRLVYFLKDTLSNILQLSPQIGLFKTTSGTKQFTKTGDPKPLDSTAHQEAKQYDADACHLKSKVTTCLPTLIPLLLLYFSVLYFLRFPTIFKLSCPQKTQETMKKIVMKELPPWPLYFSLE